MTWRKLLVYIQSLVYRTQIIFSSKLLLAHIQSVKPFFAIPWFDHTGPYSIWQIEPISCTSGFFFFKYHIKEANLNQGDLV